MTSAALPRIVFPEAQSLPATLRRPSVPHEWVEYPSTERDQLVARLSGAQIAIINKLPLRSAVLSKLPDLKMIAISATGADNVDTAWCRDHGVVVSNIRGYAVNTVPEHVMMMALALSRNLVSYRVSLAQGRWQQSQNFCLLDHPISDLHGGVMGIVGRGTLGERVAHIARAFGMEVMFAERRDAPSVREGYVAFEEVLEKADVLTLHCPLTTQTDNLIDRRALSRMKKTALLINTSRGGLVDYGVLLDALRSGNLGGAGIDVLPVEPPVGGHPLLDAAMPNLIVTPHVAWGSVGSRQTQADQLIDNIEAFLRGEPRNRLA